MPTVWISSPYGRRVHPMTGKVRKHNGIDIAVPQGTPIYVAAPGRVSRVWLDDEINGHAVRVDHGGGWASSYVHLSRVDVTPGQLVDRRRPIGLSGGTPGTRGAGRSNGPHLHFVVWAGGQSVDPLPRVSWQNYGYNVAFR